MPIGKKDAYDVGTISNLKEWLARKSRTASPPVVVGAFGFSVGSDFVAWQTLSEIWVCKTELVTADEAVLEFVAGGLTLRACESQPGFPSLEAAMIGVFPSTAAWREAISVTPPCNRTLLYRRAIAER